MSKVAYYINGQKVTPEEFRQKGKSNWLDGPPMHASTYTEHNPLISDGIGCMKSQVKEMREAIKQHNIQGASVLENGQIRFTSRRARKELMAMRGLADADGGYSD